MITLTKNGNAIVFTFEDNAHYLFDGTISVPINSLTLITDNSQMATFKKSASNDVFISARYDELGMSKAELESWFKENACGSTGGGGVTSGEVETMIDQAISGKQDTLIAGSGITISGNVISSEGGNKAVELTQAQYDELVSGGTVDPDTFYIITDAEAIDINNYYNKTEVDEAIDDAKAYYISFATIATTGIRDEDWDGIVAAIDAHRPIYAGYPRQDGGILYYGVECMNKNSDNTQIILTSSDDSVHYFYTFTKNGSNDYSFSSETRPYTTQAEKDAWNAKQDALSAGTGIEISGNVISATGGGATYSAGTNISIANDTINCTLPYHKLDGVSNYSIYGNTRNKVYDAENTLFIGESNEVTGNSASRTYYCNCVIGYNNKINAYIKNYLKGYNVVIGDNNTLSGTDLSYSYVIGKNNSGYTSNTLLIGWYNQAYNGYESALGKYNASNTGSTNADKSLFSVGNGTSDSARHNAFEIRQNGDIYIALNGQDVKLQDQLGGGSITVDSALDATSENPVQNKVIYAVIGDIESLLSNI